MLSRFKLFDAVAPFRRCLRCSGLLEPIAKEDVLDRLEPRTRQYYHEFAICRACDQIFWKGSHYQRMQRLVQRVVDARASHGAARADALVHGSASRTAPR